MTDRSYAKISIDGDWLICSCGEQLAIMDDWEICPTCDERFRPNLSEWLKMNKEAEE